MTVSFPENALPPTDAPGRPSADVVFWRILKEHPSLAAFGLTLELANEPSARTAPWLRLQVVRYLEPSQPGESTPICSLDVFADDIFEAERIATEIARVWPYLKKVRVPTAMAYVSGGWVSTDPYPVPERDPASNGERLYRFHLEVGLRLHPTQGA